MIIYKDNFLTVAFGDKASALNPAEHCDASMQEFMTTIQQSILPYGIGYNTLYVLKQIHSSKGFVFNQSSTTHIKPFGIEGDFLLTNKRESGLTVLTADCLPIIVYDIQNHCVGLIHAGWRGSLQGIVSIAIKNMEQVFGTHARAIRAFLGPSAQWCCYAVGTEIVNAVGYKSKFIRKEAGEYFFARTA